MGNLRNSDFHVASLMFSVVTYQIVILSKSTQQVSLFFQLQSEFSFSVITILTCLITDTESQVEGDDPGHRPRHCLHGEGAFVVVQQGDEGGHICKPAPNTSAKMSHISAKIARYTLLTSFLSTHLIKNDLITLEYDLVLECFASASLPAKRGDPSAQFHVAVRTEMIAADKQLHRVIPLSTRRVPPARARQGGIQLQSVKVRQA